MHLQTTASRAVTLLTKRPGLFCRVMIGKVNAMRRLPPLPAITRMNGVFFEHDLADYRGTAPMYFGSYAPLVVEAMKRYLSPGGVFIDIGANIGYLSAIAAGLVGPQGQVHAFEPVPDYCEKLRRVARLNPGYKISVNAQAAGEIPGMYKIYVTREPGQNSLIRAYQQAADIVSTVDVRVVRLDDYIESANIQRISLIKIDTEGFELPVLKGLERYFASTMDRPPVICEIAPRAYALQGRRLADLARYMARRGYSARDLIDSNARVDITAIKHVDDVLFLADKAN